ncbi:hypothetical protein CCYA_CCYA01G0345 [Cyanidiococcus yangmingshanensis]|nr:hypothetical protein CCYA_CCYA01G0345 [Cyanidiococcus yangmingshanensis]
MSEGDVKRQDLTSTGEEAALARDAGTGDCVDDPLPTAATWRTLDGSTSSLGSDANLAAVEAARRLARMEFRRSLQRTMEQLKEEVPLLGRLIEFERQLDLRVARTLQLRSENAAAALLLDAASGTGDVSETKPMEKTQGLGTAGLAFPSLTARSTKPLTFRLFVYNTFEGQATESSEGAAQPLPSWVLCIQGHVLDASPASEFAFTSVFERVLIEIDPENAFRQFETIEWIRPYTQDVQVGAGATSTTNAVAATNQAGADQTPSSNIRDGPSASWRPASSATRVGASATAPVSDIGERDPADDAVADGIEVRRCGDQPVPIRILLYLRRYPPVYRLSPELVALLGVEQDTLAGVLTTLWHYIRRQGLVHPERPDVVLLNEELRHLFGWRRHAGAPEHPPPEEGECSLNSRDQENDDRAGGDDLEETVPMMPMGLIAGRLREHLGPAPPIEIGYTIQLQSPVEHDCYDIEIDLPTDVGLSVNVDQRGTDVATELATMGRSISAGPTAAESSVAAADLNHIHEGAAKPNNRQLTPQLGRCSLYAESPEIQNLQRQFEETLERIHTASLRRDFFQSFATSPTEFLRDLIVSQARDIRLVRGQSGRTIEEERRSGLYYQQWVHEAVPRYLWRTLRAREQQQHQIQVPGGDSVKPAPSASHPVA